MSAPIIKRRTRFFLGCEGKSEKAYGQLIQDIAWEDSLPITFEIFGCGGGDPLVVASRAVDRCTKTDSEIDPFVAKFIFLDSDRLDDMTNNDITKLKRLLSDNNFLAIWQKPDHEGFLLRHFSGHENDCPPRGQSLKALQSVWTGYKKGMTRRDYVIKITLDEVKRAANGHPELKLFLQAVGLIKPED